MARNLGVAIESIYQSYKQKSSLAIAKVASWIRSEETGYEPDNVDEFGDTVLASGLASVVIPGYGKHTWNVDGDDLPTDLLKRLMDSETEGSTVPGMDFEVVVCKCARSTHPSEIDPVQARTDFLALPQTTTALKEFLENNGIWSEEGELGEEVVFPQKVWNYQRWIRGQMALGREAWLTNYWLWGKTMRLLVKSEFPHLRQVDTYCKDAIASSITLDFMRGVEFAFCRRPDCNRIFEASYKGKIFCSQYCGHLVSVRKSRKQARKVGGKKGKAHGTL